MNQKRLLVGLVLSVMVLAVVWPAGGRRQFSLTLDGGSTWGAALNARLAVVELGLRLIGGLEIRAGYTHYFNPRFWEEEDSRQRLAAGTIGLRFSLPFGHSDWNWAACVNGGIFRHRVGGNWPPGQELPVVNEFGLGLGLDLEHWVSSLFGIRLAVRGWTFFHKDSFFGEAWPETRLGIVFRF